MSNGVRADYSRTCEGCGHVVTEPWPRGQTGFRCDAPGPCRGYLIGIGRFLPYIPAWCQFLEKESRREQ